MKRSVKSTPKREAFREPVDTNNGLHSPERLSANVKETGAIDDNFVSKMNKPGMNDDEH